MFIGLCALIRKILPKYVAFMKIEMVPMSEVLKILLDDKSIDFFNSIASSKADNVALLRNKLGPTRKQTK